MEVGSRDIQLENPACRDLDSPWYEQATKEIPLLGTPNTSHVCAMCNHIVPIHDFFDLYSICPECHTKSKLRAYGPLGYEPMDALEVADQWLKNARARAKHSV